VLVGGGIGITPIQAMAHHLRADGRRFELHYAVRSSAEAAYLPALRREFGDALRLYAADEGQRLEVAGLLARAARDAVFYVCGPATLIDSVRAAGAAAGLPAEQIRFERFLAAPPATANRPLSVRLQRSGQRIEVRADQSILEAVEDAGVAAPSGCRNGSCGTCRVKVLAGRPEHRDSALDDAQRGAAGLMCICVSRAAGDELALDL
jgi:ferredoxin-NADP reductase